MEFNDDNSDSSNLFKAKIAELEKMKENLKKAKDDAMQSWLDSRPLIDELEKMQAELASAKARLTKANTAISEIQAQIGTIDMCIKSAKEEGTKLRIVIHDKNQDLHQTQEQMEQMKMKIDKKRRGRSKLKQVIKIKRQTLQTLELTYKAVQLESEAFAISAAQAHRHISNLEAVDIMIRLTQEEYDIFKEGTRTQISIAERRISGSVVEKLAAEKSRDTTFRRLQRLYPRSSSRHKSTLEKTAINGNIRSTTEENANNIGSQTKNRRHTSSRTQARSKEGVNQKNPENRLSNNKYIYSVSKKKSSFFIRIKTFLVRNLSKFFND